MRNHNCTEASTAIEARRFAVGALLEAGERRLREALAALGPESTPRLDAEVLLAHVLGTQRARLQSHPQQRTDAASAAAFAELIERRAAGEPAAYLVGRKEFWSLELAVGPDVLVPRPDTELLVERALALLPDERARVLDLGTGSGAIALALASERPEWLVTATDVSAAALAVARANAAALALERVEFVEGDWLECLPGRSFELIVSNPPYVAASDPALATGALRCEPRLALTAGEDGLECLERIVRDAPARLVPGGWLLLEHGAAQMRAVTAGLVARGFAQVRSHRDLAGRERTTEGEWPRHP